MRRLFLQRSASLFDLGILPFHFCVLLEQQARLFLEFFVGLLQLFLLAFSRSSDSCSVRRLLLKLSIRFRQLGLPGLQFRCQRLRLFEQLFCPHRRSDRVQHDADDLGELIEERDMNVAELVEGCQFDDGFYLAFEQDGQNDHVHRRRLAQRRTDLDVIGRNFRQQDALLLERRLADNAFTGMNTA